jgi:hypothetical protein
LPEQDLDTVTANLKIALNILKAREAKSESVAAAAENEHSTGGGGIQAVKRRSNQRAY